MLRRLALVVAAWLALGATTAAAHPLGNFSISHYAAIEPGATDVTIRYVIDMAEIPTFQEVQDTGLVTEVGHPSVAPWAAAKAAALARGLTLTLGDRPLTLTAVSHQTIFPPGAGGLPTLKLGVVYRATLPAGVSGMLELRYRDENFADRAGWKEIIARPGAGATLVASTAPAADRSRELSDYPTDLLNSPPQDLEARVSFATAPVGTAAVAPPPPTATMALRPNTRASVSNAAANRFAELVTRPEPGLGLLALALMTAAVLGAFHALEPGHGKTVVAAYLVGSRGTARHALILGLVVTASHTAGVYLLGGVTFYASRHVVPEKLYPWLSLGSGLTIAILGLALFLRRFGGVADHHHDHGGHHHHHGGLVHSHAHDGEHEHGHDHTHGPISLRALVALGVSGGIIPCPAALVVLLTALSMHRVGFGLVLIVAFSVGLAAVLMAIGVLMVYAGRLMSRFREDGPWIRRWLPLTSSAVMTLLGLGIAVQAVLPWMPR
ncbi:MAG TPA: high-affinity nickel-transporter [Methylomirabilota bacterium]|nr:high-affinity nickel-transporter [Methylomirabilota bacterium]